MINLMTIILASMILNSVFAQREIVVQSDNVEFTSKIVERGGSWGDMLYKGSPFLYNNYREGQFTIKNGKTIIAPMIFNLANDELIVKLNDQPISITNADFEINNQKFISYRNQYYQVLVDGQDKLLKRNKVDIRRIGHGVTSKIRNGYSKFDGEYVKTIEYYVQQNNHKPILINLKSKKLKNLLGLSESEIEKYLPMTDESIIYLFRNCNSINLGYHLSDPSTGLKFDLGSK